MCIPGWPHVVVQRGHHGRPVFADDDDRQRFRELLRDAARLYEVRVHAYGLFDNEVRLLTTPSTADGLSKLMQAIGRRYVARFNRRHGHSGGLWEGRFRATVIDPAVYMMLCMLYVEGVDAHPDAAATGDPWSSVLHHLGVSADSVISDPEAYWGLGNTPFDREAAYRLLWERGLTERQATDIRSALNASWPLGDDRFKAQLSDKTERRLAPRPRGRPRSEAGKLI